jgi:hypothetical protein
MPDPTQGGQGYEVHGSQKIVEDFRRVQRQAAAEGRGEQALSAVKRIYRQLQQHPTDAGEPAYRLPGLRMQVRTIVIRPLVVDYAVCEDRPIVFIKGVKLLPAPRR